ncbi:MAG: NAD(P)/FAD-dependent oxidoreductase [Clostridia bacterium]|nr:NAD(P)/FAD-dependent oxidoreductase [Clostridia bacterium]
MKKYLIIGNGTAAVGCIEGIRSIDKAGEITVISEENHHVYSRPLISYYLENKTDLEHMKYRDGDFYKNNGCRVIYGKKAVKISKTGVTLDDETVLKGDKICIATGSRPFVPPIAGLDTVEKKFGFMTLDDALALEMVLSKDARVLIVGAGLIGLKCAEGIRDRAGSVTVCDLADRVLSSILDGDCAGIVQKHLEKSGIKFMLGDTVERFEGNSALMKSGKQVDFDILVMAVGVRANSELIKSAGGEVNRGIIVNSKMETSLPHIYAAGDCAEGFDASIGKNRVLAILPNAYIGGYTAGTNMAGGEAVFDNAIPMNSIGFFGLHIMSAGDYSGVCSEERTENTLKRFFTKDGYLRGFILIGATERAGIYTALIRDKTPLKTIDFDLTKKMASNLIFSKKIRGKKFGGVV